MLYIKLCELGIWMHLEVRKEMKKTNYYAWGWGGGICRKWRRQDEHEEGNKLKTAMKDESNKNDWLVAYYLYKNSWPYLEVLKRYCLAILLSRDMLIFNFI